MTITHEIYVASSIKTVSSIKFLGNRKCRNYEQIVFNIFSSFKAKERNMSSRLHFLISHFDIFNNDVGAFSGKRGDIFTRV